MNKSGKVISHGCTTSLLRARFTDVKEMIMKIEVEHKAHENTDSRDSAHVIQDPFSSFYWTIVKFIKMFTFCIETEHGI